MTQDPKLRFKEFLAHYKEQKEVLKRMNNHKQEIATQLGIAISDADMFKNQLQKLNETIQCQEFTIRTLKRSISEQFSDKGEILDSIIDEIPTTESDS
jgi:hypothetical protein